MALFDLRCDQCSDEVERRCSYEATKDLLCEKCSGNGLRGKLHIIMTQVNLSADCTPTRAYGRTKTTPALVKSDGSAVNPGHEEIHSGMLRLNKDQVNRLGL